jgi:large subunit ribosomal protein L35
VFFGCDSAACSLAGGDYCFAMPPTGLLIFARLGKMADCKENSQHEGSKKMSKMKTRKAAAKRFKQTGTGKFMRNRANGRHILTKKSSKRKRRLGQATEVKKTELSRMKASFPYGLK